MASSVDNGTSVTIIGSGFGGIGMAVRLKERGFEDITIFEKAGDVGGVWRDNSYPGAACDVPSHLYSFSFAPKHDWSRRFAPQAEILGYLQKTAERFDVLRHVRLNTEVEGASFDHDMGRWTVRLVDGTTHTSDVLITAVGQLSRPALPRISGIDSFEGEIFHSATWNHDFDLAGKKVAVVGTGASAIQFVPHVQKQVSSLTLFQRGPAHVLPKPDYAYAEFVSAALAKVPGLHALSRWVTYWQLEPRAAAFTRFPKLMEILQRRFEKSLHAQVEDPVKRALLTPTDLIGCKRVLLSNDYYPAVVQDNVSIVNDGIVEVRPEGVVTEDGTLHEVDAIILGTGFQATDFLAPMHITGRDGLDLNEVWRDGAEAHLGISVAGFPNLFLLYGPNTNLSHSSIVFMLESQINYILQGVKKVAGAAVRSVEVRSGVQDEFNVGIQTRIGATVWDRDCRSWYKTAAGKNTTNWPGATFTYRLKTRRPDWSDFRIEPADELARPQGV
ncbi:cation diffusion facilitator CzcD-associated flavoprotein CzcO [Nocardioides albertanoniae]|uniref:Cation diffusion facilitator CzcD-associated flavoprotein CzcO n=1 Tax=Nocardioides albertanoniae TaxID=1175486 RepID=A0A543A604_9ACTN|nr:NAD(P)/FAD-dependent oxidoreductase [Nocardioides albertanoniae]TQL68033.1 cation diffusion facilitator CzcD-associated flavoprotein CzcO [Nocardioides albertanoniae]